MNLQYESIITGRTGSFFENDINAFIDELNSSISGSRIVVVGAAGSIGSAVVKTILRFKPAALTLIDLSENNLVELVRDLRSTEGVIVPEEFSTLPVGMGSIEFDRFFTDQKPFDFFCNLSAIKHVRSEKDIYCIMRMIDTNVLYLHEFLDSNNYSFKKVFSVSSDKAANPANLMGATKMVMEKALMFRADIQPFSTARFANVAFSDGSLPFGFLQRIDKLQPLSAPEDVKRYFISHREAGELCVLSCFLSENRDVYFPNLKSDKDEKTFSEIAIDLLEHLGYTPYLCQSEEEAKSCCTELIPKRKWPCYFFKTDTSGEKSFEEFYTESETLDRDTYKNIGVIKRNFEPDQNLPGFIEFVKKAKADKNLNKTDYIREIQKLVPGLQHVETGKNLDQKM